MVPGLPGGAFVRDGQLPDRKAGGLCARCPHHCQHLHGPACTKLEITSTIPRT